MQQEPSKIIVGSEEWCAFPKLGIPAIKARVDSGAKTSSLHAFDIHTFKKGDESWVSFEIHPLQQNRRVVVRCEAKIIDRRGVKSSSGVAEKRYVIKTLLCSGDECWEVEVTLTNRDSMGYRMLLGREAMKNRVLVDPDVSFCLGKISEKKLASFYPPDNDSPDRGLKIGLLASNSELYSNKRLIEAAQQRGHQIEFVDIKQCYVKLDTGSPEVLYRGGRLLNNLDAVITRIRPNMTTYGCALTRQFEIMGVLTCNKSEAIAQSRDKLLLWQLMLKNGINVPTSVFGDSSVDTVDLIDTLDGAPLMIRLFEGGQSKELVLAKTRKTAESVINAFKSLKANFLVQKPLNDTGIKGIRCLVIDGKVVASIRKEIDFREHKSTRSQNASVVKITKEERKLALLATKVLGLKIAGIDIARSENEPLLVAVKSSPSLDEIEAATGKDIAGMMIASIEKKLGWKRELAIKQEAT